MSATGSLLSLRGDPEAESLVPSSIVSWRIILALCRRVRSSFLPVSSVSPGLSYPTPSLSPCLPLPYHYLGCCSLRRGAVWYHIVACTVFTTGLFWCGGTAFASYERYWIVTSDSQSSHTGRDTLWYVFCGCLLGRVSGSRSHASSEFEVGCLCACIFVGQRCFQPRVQSAKWADSPRAPSQVNGRSSPHYDSRSLSQSRRICIPRRLLVWRQYPWDDEHLKQKWNLHFKVEGRETSLNPGGQQGTWFPASLWRERSGGGAAPSIVSQTGSRSASRSSSTR